MGEQAMTPHPNIAQHDAYEMARYILFVKNTTPSHPIKNDYGFMLI